MIDDTGRRQSAERSSTNQTPTAGTDPSLW
jgi:hypothetical protein